MPLCYKDKTFCSAAGSECGNTSCHRYLKEAGIRHAYTIKLPVAYSYFYPTCAIRKPINPDIDEHSVLEVVDMGDGTVTMV